jgi:hypothetical protein
MGVVVTRLDAANKELAAVIGWGVGLFVFGLAVTGAAAGFIANYNGWPQRYVESIVAARRKYPLVGRQADRIDARTMRIGLGLGFAFLGVVFLSVGILGLVSYFM